MSTRPPTRSRASTSSTRRPGAGDLAGGDQAGDAAADHDHVDLRGAASPAARRPRRRRSPVERAGADGEAAERRRRRAGCGGRGGRRSWRHRFREGYVNMCQVRVRSLHWSACLRYGRRPQPPRSDGSRRRSAAAAASRSILDAAARLVVERGVDALTTRDIAEAAGVPVASLYQYFADKEDVLLALAAARHGGDGRPGRRGPRRRSRCSTVAGAGAHHDAGVRRRSTTGAARSWRSTCAAAPTRRSTSSAASTTRGSPRRCTPSPSTRASPAPS